MEIKRICLEDKAEENDNLWSRDKNTSKKDIKCRNRRITKMTENWWKDFLARGREKIKK